MQRCIVEEALPIQNAVSDRFVHQRMITVDRARTFSAQFAHLVIGPIERHRCFALEQSLAQANVCRDGRMRITIE